MQKAPIDATEIVLWYGQQNQLCIQIANQKRERISNHAEIGFAMRLPFLRQFCHVRGIFVRIAYHPWYAEHIDEPSYAEVTANRRPPNERLKITAQIKVMQTKPSAEQPQYIGDYQWFTRRWFRISE